MARKTITPPRSNPVAAFARMLWNAEEPPNRRYYAQSSPEQYAAFRAWVEAEATAYDGLKLEEP